MSLPGLGYNTGSNVDVRQSLPHSNLRLEVEQTAQPWYDTCFASDAALPNLHTASNSANKTDVVLLAEALAVSKLHSFPTSLKQLLSFDHQINLHKR